jgi:uncharacterized protein (TIGR02246 family)
MKLPAMVLALAVGAASSAAAQSVSDSASVVAVVEQFHAALARGDSARAFEILAPDVMVLESGGLETAAEYRSHHLPGDIAFAQAVKSERKVEQVRVSGDAAWVVATSTTEGKFRDRPVNSVGVELMVLSRRQGAWLISAIHWSARRRAP